VSKRTNPYTYSLLQRFVLSVPLLVSAVFASPSVQGEETIFPGLEALMSEEEFERSGLEQLSPAQRATLNRWLSERAQFKLEETDDVSDSTAADLKAIEAEGQSDQRAQSKGPKAESQVASEKPKKLVARRLSKTERQKVKPLRTRIVGPFRGWTGSTLFQLENGQIWKQRQNERYYYKAESPEVEVYKNRFGFWEIRILATGKSVKVPRYEP